MYKVGDLVWRYCQSRSSRPLLMEKWPGRVIAVSEGRFQTSVRVEYNKRGVLIRSSARIEDLERRSLEKEEPKLFLHA